MRRFITSARCAATFPEAIQFIRRHPEVLVLCSSRAAADDLVRSACETALPGRQRQEQSRAEPGQRKPARGAPQRTAPRRTEAAQRSAKRTASPTAGKGKQSTDDRAPAETPERPRAARRK